MCRSAAPRLRLMILIPAGRTTPFYRLLWTAGRNSGKAVVKGFNPYKLGYHVYGSDILIFHKLDQTYELHVAGIYEDRFSKLRPSTTSRTALETVISKEIRTKDLEILEGGVT